MTERTQPVRLFHGEHAGADVHCVDVHPNSNYVATGAQDGLVRLFDVRDAQCVRTLTGSGAVTTRVRISADGRCLASGARDGQVLVHDLAAGRALLHYAATTQPTTSTPGVKTKPRPVGAVFALQFTRDTHTLAVGYQNAAIRFLNVDGHAAHETAAADAQPKSVVVCSQ